MVARKKKASEPRGLKVFHLRPRQAYAYESVDDAILSGTAYVGMTPAEARGRAFANLVDRFKIHDDIEARFQSKDGEWVYRLGQDPVLLSKSES